MKRVLLTGASGFVGSHVLRHILINTDWEVVCLTTFKHKGLQDRIKFAVSGVDDNFDRVDILLCDLGSPISPLTARKFGKIDYVINVASESHVDRSIDNPTPFILNNISRNKLLSSEILLNIILPRTNPSKYFGLITFIYCHS